MKGVILAGGKGSRLYPVTQVTSKILLPIYDKPLVYYPLALLIEGGIRDILVISSPDQLTNFQLLLGDGSSFGIDISYTVQEKAEGIAQALILAEEFINGDQLCLILGDNVFVGGDIGGTLKSSNKDNFAATIFAYPVVDPARFGVVEMDRSGKAISLVEKPSIPKSNLAVPGLYIYDARAVQIAKALGKSPRGEYEITDVNINYLESYQLQVVRLNEKVHWFDAGTERSLLQASNYISDYQSYRQCLVGSPEKAAYQNGLISQEQLEALVSDMPVNDYSFLLTRLLR